MAVLIQCRAIAKRFGARPLFNGISLGISDRERIGLIGPNGAGKTTLMRILAGLDQPDEGEVAVRRQARIAYVPQEPEFDASATVRSAVEPAIDAADPAEREARLNVVLGRAGFTDFSTLATSLSGGRRKRLAIARELAREPDLLLLDEPTNHLDVDAILWLEDLLAAAPFACVAVSHDRYFLENVATDMVEINRVYPDGLFRAPGVYSDFLLAREDFLAAQSKQQDALENRVRREVEWLRRGPKARTSKSRARIDAAHRMIGELADVQSRTARATAQIDFTASERKTKRLIDVDAISKQMGGRALFRDLSFTLGPGTRLGLVGPNGSGKTTLLGILAGAAEPDAGAIKRADALRVVVFDQHREQLDPGVSLRRALSPHGDTVIFRDRPVHVAGWAKRFLFRDEQLDVSVGRLSGGERARVLIARLMLEPADVLLLDEPTNDLDIPTLEVLEETLLEFPGALVLVTHDRHMLDRVSNVVLGLDGEGGAGVFADYSQWQYAREEAARDRARGERPAAAARTDTPAPKKKLSYLEQREWDAMEEKIHAAEHDVAARESLLHDPAVASDAQRLHDAYAAWQTAQAEVERLYARWAELEAKLG